MAAHIYKNIEYLDKQQACLTLYWNYAFITKLTCHKFSIQVVERCHIQHIFVEIFPLDHQRHIRGIKFSPSINISKEEKIGWTMEGLLVETRNT